MYIVDTTRHDCMVIFLSPGVSYVSITIVSVVYLLASVGHLHIYPIFCLIGVLFMISHLVNLYLLFMTP